MQDLNAEKFLEALKSINTQEAIEGFIKEHKMGVTAEEIIAIAKMVCAIGTVVCPIINELTAE
jgi:hypothetical protein